MTRPAYGGQAVIEGVMMRGQRDMAVAVRRPSGEVYVHNEPLTSAIYTSSWAKLPFLRGLVMLWDSLVLGTRVLMFSANIAAEEDSSATPELTSKVMWSSLVIGLLVAVGLFFVLPVLLVSVIDPILASPFWSNVVEKVFRIALVIGYIAAIGFLPDIKRVFAYHGAEHKAINAFEDGAALEPAVVNRYSTAHPRCGTSFLLIVLIVSFIAFLLLGQPPMLERVVSRIILIPIVAGVSYELIRLGAAHYSNPMVRVLLAPGMAVQRLTTREPDLSMVEVSIAALKRIIAVEQAAAEKAAIEKAQPAEVGATTAAMVAGLQRDQG